MAVRGISFALRVAALIATIAVVGVALFLSATAPFTPTRGPVSAFRALPTDAIEFTVITISATFALTLAMSRVHYGNTLPAAVHHQPSPIMALRC